MFKGLIGTPFVDGDTDCWWATREGFKRYGIDIPLYNPAMQAVKELAFSPADIEEAIKDVALQGWERIDQPEEPCGVVMQNAKSPGVFSHICLYIGKGRILNSRRGVGCVIERLDHPLLKNKEKRYYKYVG